MEKRKPHYDFSAVQSAIRLRGADAFTLRQDGVCRDSVQGEMR